MNMQIQCKQIIMLVLSIILAVGSYWIPLPPIATIQNSKLPEMVTQSTSAESEIFTGAW